MVSNIVLEEETGCSECGFELWLPIAPLNDCHLGLYDDSRFPGRCILMFDKHYNHFDELTDDEAFKFFIAIQVSVKAIKTVTGVDRVNITILGNTLSHVHAHLIPRYPESDSHHEKAPWEDTRKKEALSSLIREELINNIRMALTPPVEEKR